MPFAAGQRLTAQLLNDQFRPTVWHAPLDAGEVTSLAYTQTRTTATTPVGIEFTAPTSGRITVTWHCAIRVDGGTNFGLCAIGLRTGNIVGDGIDVVIPSDDLACQSTPNAADAHWSMSHPFDLTPGEEYNATLWFRVNGSTGTFSRPAVYVRAEP